MRMNKPGTTEDEQIQATKVQPKDYSYHTAQQSKTAKTDCSSYHKGKGCPHEKQWAGYFS